VSIRLRLTIWYGAVLATVLIAAGALVWVEVDRDLRASLEDALQVQATDVRAGFDVDHNVSLLTRDPARPGVFTVVLSSAGAALRSTSNAPVLPPGLADGRSELTIDGRTYAVYAVTASDGSQIVAGSSLAEVDRTIDTLTNTMLLVAGVAVLVALATGWWLAGRALAPTATIGTELASIGVEDLGRRVGHRSREDEIGRLAAAINAMLERIDDGVRRHEAFVAAASHDLRTPLTALRTELELAVRGQPTRAQLVAAIQAAHGDAVRLGNLANDLLALAEAEPGGRQLVRQPVEARALLEGCVSDQGPLARERSIAITLDAPEAVVNVDRSRIAQAVRNLLANALRFSPSGSTVALTARTLAGPGDARRALEVSVGDHGPGVAPTMRDRLFLPFAARSDGEHSGLGLATAAAAVRAHGGTISYHDRPGGGAEFVFTVPA
jgi:two-component system OmpR family sensor kinase